MTSKRSKAIRNQLGRKPQDRDDVLRSLQNMKPGAMRKLTGIRTGTVIQRLTPGHKYERFLPGISKGHGKEWTKLIAPPGDHWAVDGEILGLEDAADKIWKQIVVDVVMGA